jgi:CRISPR system Cascade subunit CasD
MDILILRLRGPLMAFGDVAVDELRPTDVLPGISLVTGLLGNALGWLYIHGERLQALQDRLRLASRLDREGSALRDYQNARITKDDKLWRSKGGSLSRDLGAAGESIVQRERYYRADAAVTAALTLEPSHADPSLDALEEALRRPARPLFLGRSNCPPSEPVLVRRVQASSLEEALRREPLPRGERQSFSLLLDVPAEDGAGVDGIRERYDLRDWRNGVHAGSRLVRRIPMTQEEKP